MTILVPSHRIVTPAEHFAQITNAALDKAKRFRSWLSTLMAQGGFVQAGGEVLKPSGAVVGDTADCANCPCPGGSPGGGGVACGDCALPGDVPGTITLGLSVNVCNGCRFYDLYPGANSAKYEGNPSGSYSLAFAGTESSVFGQCCVWSWTGTSAAKWSFYSGANCNGTKIFESAFLQISVVQCPSGRAQVAVYDALTPGPGAAWGGSSLSATCVAFTATPSGGSGTPCNCATYGLGICKSDGSATV